jgi:lactate dehydrogenase-like 2-hydroxyacid dehydrogenase
MSKPIILQAGPYPDWDQIPLDAAFDSKRFFDVSDPAEVIATYGPQARGIAMRGEIGADVALCCEKGIRVTNTPDVLTGDVADLGVAMMLCQSRGMIGAEAWVRRGNWATHGLYDLKRRVFGRRAGIPGLGRIGFEVGKRLAGFDMDIAYTDVAAKDYAPGWTFLPDAKALADHADFLFVTLAASAETRHIVNREIIEAVGPDGMIINISRAPNIDEEALIKALGSGALGSAALDVFKGEPALDPRFLELPNVLLQPHHASGTIETRKAMGQLMRDNLVAHFAGQPLLTPVV